MAVLWDAALEVSDEMTSNARCWFRKYRPLTRNPREGRNHGERDYNRGQVTSYIAVPTLLQCPRCHFNTHQEQKSRGGEATLLSKPDWELNGNACIL